MVGSVTRSGRTVTIRAASEQDIPALVECDGATTTDEEVAGWGRPKSERLFGSSQRLLAVWRSPNRVGTKEVYVADDGGHVVAMVIIEDRGTELELDDIEVRREHQHRGIGTQLVRFVESRASQAGMDAVTLGTSRNADGVPWSSFPWWQKQGYVVTGEVENDWTRSIGTGVREIRMRKALR